MAARGPFGGSRLTLPDRISRWMSRKNASDSPAGWILMLAGAALVVACVGVFVAFGRGTAAPFDPPREFVPVGPYRFVRNPMYIGAWLVLAGWGLAQRSAAVLLLSLGMLLVFHLFVVVVEEPGLRRRFGRSYEEYTARTRRWLPRVPNRTS